MRSGLFGTSCFKRASSSGFVATEPAPHREGAEFDRLDIMAVMGHGSIGCCVTEGSVGRTDEFAFLGLEA